MFSGPDLKSIVPETDASTGTSFFPLVTRCYHAVYLRQENFFVSSVCTLFGRLPRLGHKRQPLCSIWTYLMKSVTKQNKKKTQNIKISPDSEFIGNKYSTVNYKRPIREEEKPSLQISPLSSYVRSPRNLRASARSFGWIVTRLAWIAAKFVSSNSETRYASAASCRAITAEDWNRRSV